MIDFAKVTRRTLLRASMGGLASMALPVSRAEAGKPAADACIFVFCWGAPSQFETFDPKPLAPDGVRGEFGAIRTRNPGVLFGEHIPALAARNDQYTIVRTCAQSSTHHQSAAYEALTGYPPSQDAVALTATPTDHPNIGSVVARFANHSLTVPAFVQLPQLASDVGNLTPGQFAGYLGRTHDPLTIVRDPNDPGFSIPELSLPADVTVRRLDDRAALLRLIDRQMQGMEDQSLSPYQQRAVKLLTDPSVRAAFDLAREPGAMRDRYGRNTLGQSLLLARRLVETGVKFVTVMSGFNGKAPQDAWDTHKDNFRKLKRQLLPPLDLGVSTLLDDLRQRGLNRRTLVMVLGEFGRTPRINRDAGRDHWHHCYSVMLAGGGVAEGRTLGESDRGGAYPSRGEVRTPADLCATAYHLLGIDPHVEAADQAGRPIPITRGQVVREVLD